MLSVCVTGHRPAKIGGYDPENPTRAWVRSSLRTILDTIKPNYAYIGMALGVDQDFAEACIEAGVPFTAALPFKGQETKWPEASQMWYWRLVHQAKTIHTVCEPGYAAWKMQRRNQWMVDEIGPEGLVIAVWDGSTGGTANCVAYARQMRRKILRVDPLARTIIYPPT